MQDLGSSAAGDDLSQEAHNAHQLALLESRLNEILTPSSITQSRLQRDVQVITLLDDSDYLQPEQQEEYFTHIDDDTDGDDDCAYNTRLCHRLATKLSSIGYGVLVRHSVSGGKGSEMFNNLRNDFLVVTALSDFTGTTTTPIPLLQEFIVGPCFQDHFTIPHLTARYMGLLSLLPSTLVATPNQLKQLVDLLCAEMHIAFEQCGFSLPPWRQAKSLLSKWLPTKSKDVDMSPGGSPRWCSTPGGGGGGDGSLCTSEKGAAAAFSHHRSSQHHYNKQPFHTNELISDRSTSTSMSVCFSNIITCSTAITRVESPRTILQQASDSLSNLKDEECRIASIAAQRSLLSADLASSGKPVTVEQDRQPQQDNSRRGKQAFKIQCQACYAEPAIITVKRKGAA
jgi:uncharacterized protein (TIGR01615 family)